MPVLPAGLLPARLPVLLTLANLAKALVLLVAVGQLSAASTRLVIADRQVGVGGSAALVVVVDALRDVALEDSVSLVLHGKGRHGGKGQSHGKAGEDGFGDHLDGWLLEVFVRVGKS